MDRNTIAGLVVIAAILFGFTWWNSKQAQKYNIEKARADSIARAEGRLIEVPQSEWELDPINQSELSDSSIDTSNAAETIEQTAVISNSVSAHETTAVDATHTADSIRQARYGNYLIEAQNGSEKLFIVENEVIKLTFSNKGGKIVGAQLKGYETYYGDPLEIIAPESANFDLTFFIRNLYSDTRIMTGDYYFECDLPSHTEIEADSPDRILVMRLPVDAGSYVEYKYTIPANDYMIGFELAFVNMDHLFSNQASMLIEWGSVARQNEKGFENENKYSTIAYKFPGDDSPDNIGISDNTREKELKTNVQWIAFKQQFFSSVFIADNNFMNARLKYDTYIPESENLKRYHAEISVPLNRHDPTYSFKFFYGPNKYSLLKSYDQSMERLVPLGWSIVRWVNKWIVIPVFDFLDSRIANYGIIILLLTLLVKIIILPLTYKSYLSMAKMRLLKPEMEAIAEKYPKKEDSMKKSQETMALYKRAGVSPMGGCIPMLIQFPILVALFYFFPTSIELRGESFLWADDLSSYDSILNLPFKIPFYGNHVSLFTLLMAVSLIISTKLNSQASAGAAQMGSMKFITYFMPIMFLFFFNNYASGLTYYYFLSNLITMGQMWMFRFVVNDEKLHARMMANAAANTKKPKKKSKFQLRYEEMMKAQQQQQKAQQGKGKGKGKR